MKEQEWDAMIEEIIEISKTNPDKASELYKTAYKKVENWEQLSVVADGVANRLNNKEWGRVLLEEMVQKAETASEYCISAELISHPDGLADKTWAKELFETALEKADSDEMIADIKDSMDECLED
jgi:hypothetical protein